MEPIFQPVRNSYMELGVLYFWTATINNWRYLLERDEYKQVVINSMQYLSDEDKVDVFAFVVMPNHVHLIWRIKELNGKESPQGSLLKYTAHVFRTLLLREGAHLLVPYRVDAVNKQHEFWQRNPWPYPCTRAM